MKVKNLAIWILAGLFLVSCAISPDNGTKNNNGGSIDTGPVIPNLTGVFVSPIGNDTNAGTNRSAPLFSIARAVSNAAANGLTNIYVSQGTYRPGSGLSSGFSGLVISNSGLNFSGGWDTNFISPSGESVLDGTNSLYHVISMFSVSNVILQRFTFRNGNANGGNVTNSIGAGMFLTNVFGCLFTNLVVSNNTALLAGPGIWMSGNSNVLSVRSVHNSTDIYNGLGGGMYLGTGSYYNVIGGVFDGNTAYYGGGLLMDTGTGYNTVTGSYRNNYGFYGGGGIALFSSHTNLINATVSSNMSAGYGGGYYINANDNTIKGYVTSNYCTMYCGGVYYTSANRNVLTANVTDNSCYYYGGGIYINSGSANSIVSMVLRNVSSASYGGGISDYGTGTAITNCLIVNNSAYYNGGGLHNMYDNSFSTNGSLIFNNTPDDYCKW